MNNQRRWQIIGMQALRRMLDRADGQLTTRQRSMVTWLVEGHAPRAEHVQVLRDLGVADWPMEIDDLAQVHLRKHEDGLTMIAALREALEGDHE